MKLLFDQNLSRRLVRSLDDAYPGSAHVIDAHLERADDRIVWEYAKEQGFTIVSKDSDFRQLSFLYGPPPKTIWLRVGNAPTSFIETLLRSSVAIVEAFGEDVDLALLILPWAV